MEPLTSPTDAVREYAEHRADNICADIARAETEIKCLLEQKVYANGVRGSAIAIRSKLEDVQSLVTRLRKAIHDDFGPKPIRDPAGTLTGGGSFTAGTFTATTIRDPEDVAMEAQDMLAEMREATDGSD